MEKKVGATLFLKYRKVEEMLAYNKINVFSRLLFSFVYICYKKDNRRRENEKKEEEVK